MNNQRPAFRILFKLRVLSSSGQSYEDLVVAVLSATFPSFDPVKPQGRLGDRKNDGFVRDTGTYFQVYAPENPKSGETVGKAVTKAVGDFKTLYDFWNEICPVQRYFFSFNDKYRGTQPSLELALSKLKEDYELDHAEVFLAKHLEDLFMKLSYEDMVDVVGFLPEPEAFPPLEAHALHDVLNHVLYSPRPATGEGKLNAPDFDKKLVFNKLSREVQAHLQFGSYQTGVIDEYFSGNSVFHQQQIRDIINGHYLSHLEGECAGDFIFHALVNDIMPENSGIAHATAAYVVLAYYFESCDVFEDPDDPSVEGSAAEGSAAEESIPNQQEAGGKSNAAP